jgi:hypothetical protein
MDEDEEGSLVEPVEGLAVETELLVKVRKGRGYVQGRGMTY